MNDEQRQNDASDAPPPPPPDRHGWYCECYWQNSHALMYCQACGRRRTIFRSHTD